MKKYNIESVSKAFGLEGYELVSNDAYINDRQKFGYVRPHGHKHSIRFDKWLEGRRCPYCDGQGKPSIEFIRSEFVKEGCILLSKKYINSKIDLDYMCSEWHEHSIPWRRWKVGQRCRHRSDKYVSVGRITDYFSDRGYKVISINELGWQANIVYECSFGHRHTIKFNSKKSLGCPTCAYIKKSGSGHPNWKGGISCEPYCDAWADKEYKKSILERDGYRCQNPSCFGIHKKLVIHHIDYDKKNCHPTNLITLCNSCNSRVNFNREFFSRLFNENNEVWWGVE